MRCKNEHFFTDWWCIQTTAMTKRMACNETNQSVIETEKYLLVKIAFHRHN